MERTKLYEIFDVVYSREDGLKPNQVYVGHIVKKNNIVLLFFIENDPKEDLIQHKNVVSFIIRGRGPVSVLKNLLEFCQSNLVVCDTNTIKQRLLGDSNYIIKEYECLGYCFECSEKPYVVFNQEYVDAENNESLLRKIVEMDIS